MRALLIVALALFTPAVVVAHPATEQFIPIGQSPGAVTMQGQVTTAAQPSALGAETSFSMTAAGAARDVSYVVGPNTRIYVDRSQHGRANTHGTIADLQAGRLIEVCVADTQSRVALWIKVRADQ